VQNWLPENHLARFVVDIVDLLDLSEQVKRDGGSGKEPCHPVLLLALLFYGYAIEVFSSRKLEQATHDSVAMRFITADEHPVTTRSPSSASVFYQCWKACLCRY
jgi:transposase